MEVKDYEDLKKCLDDNLIGDGVTGYKQEIGKAKKGNYWTGLIIFAVILFVALSVSLYGLNVGWFNNFLPGLSENTIEEAPKQEEANKPIQVPSRFHSKLLKNSATGVFVFIFIIAILGMLVTLIWGRMLTASFILKLFSNLIF